MIWSMYGSPALFIIYLHPQDYRCTFWTSRFSSSRAAISSASSYPSHPCSLAVPLRTISLNFPVASSLSDSTAGNGGVLGSNDFAPFVP